jgi:uncharacterized protein with HEPN domain
MRSRCSDGLAYARLEHARDVIDEIEAFGDYLREAMLRRGIEIISEASRHIPAALKARHPDIPWREIAGIGNVLRHGYEAIDDREIWRVVSRDLPPLKVTIEAMLREVEADDGA